MKPRVFVPAVLSGLLLWAAYFPLDAGPVAFVALVPLMAVVRAERVGPTRRYLAAFAGGLTFSLLALNWVRVAHPMMALFAWPALSLYVAAYWPLAVFLLRWLDRAGGRVGLPLLKDADRDGGRLLPPLAVTLPVVWVALEYLRAHFPTGFPFLARVGAYQPVGFGWYLLGYTQHRMLPLLQAADLGGVYLVSAVVAAVNGAAYDWAVRTRPFRRLAGMPPGWQPPTFFREFAVTAGVTGLVGAVVVYGSARLAHPPYAPGPFVAAVQGSVPQNEKMIRGDRADGRGETPLQREYFGLVRRAAGGGSVRRPDLIVWPETCFPDDWVEPTAAPNPPDGFARASAVMRQVFAALARREWQTHSLIGLNTLSWDGAKLHRANSAVLVAPDGRVTGRYDKMHLVPFGEYVPLRDWFPWLQRFTPYRGRDYSCTPGAEYDRPTFAAKDGTEYRFGVLVCYEDSDPYLARQYHPWAGRGPGVDFLVNMSNDGWFDGTEEHEQHLAICRFRAVEARRAVVRAVNMGVSAVIDPDGRVVALPESTWAKSVKVRGVVRATVPRSDRDSVYALAGDWVPGLCWLLLGLTAVRRKAKQD